jgi:hypothetical protein
MDPRRGRASPRADGLPGQRVNQETGFERLGKAPLPVSGAWAKRGKRAKKEVQMAVAVVLEFSGMGLDQYDQVVKKMGFRKGGPGPPGALFHWVTDTQDGIRVTDVWDNGEDFQRFADEKIGPITREVGFSGEPKITFYEVHNYLTAG